MRIVLCGNPNAGKTTLFNRLSGKNEKVGNWHGVTVAEKSAEYVFRGKRYSVTDLPGLYTVKGSGAEERIAENFLREKNYDVIVVVIEAKNAPRGLRLVEELKAFQKPIIAFINLYDDFVKLGGKIDGEKAKRAFGVETVFGEAKDKSSAKELEERIERGISLPRRGEKIEFFAPPSRKRGMDGLFSSPVFSAFALLFFTVVSFYLAFGNYGIGKAASGFIYRINENFLTPAVLKLTDGRTSEFLSRLLTEGLLNGVFSVLAFIPQIATLSFCTETLDRSGVFSRLSATFDPLFGKVGLSGKALYTLAGGFGCTALAASLAVGIDDEKVRKRAVLSLPFISCSARTPVYMFVADRFLGGAAFAVIAVVYVLSVILSALHSYALYRLSGKKKGAPMITELADIRFPDMKGVLKSLLKTAEEFIIRIGTVITLLSVALFIASNFSFSGYLGKGCEENSVLAFFAKKITFLFFPVGITDWRFSAAIISGIFAKEGVASTLAVLLPPSFALTVRQGIAVTVFCYLYTPCLTALAAIRARAGTKLTVLSAVWQFAVALSACYSVYYILFFV